MACERNILPALNQLYYVLIMIMGGWFVLRNLNKTVTSFDVTFLFLIIFGFSLLLLIQEAQSRYKAQIIPYIMVVASLGLSECFELIVPFEKKLSIYFATRKRENN